MEANSITLGSTWQHADGSTVTIRGFFGKPGALKVKGVTSTGEPFSQSPEGLISAYRRV